MTINLGGPRPGDYARAQWPVAVYGPKAIYENILVKLYVKMQALRDTMATGYDPTFTYVYQYHYVANLLLNAVTVGIENVDAQEAAGVGPDGVLAFYDITASIRVHTAYKNSRINESDNAYLLDQVELYLNQYREIGANYMVQSTFDINPSVEFSESATSGGEMRIFIQVARSHEQS